MGSDLKIRFHRFQRCLRHELHAVKSATRIAQYGLAYCLFRRFRVASLDRLFHFAGSHLEMAFGLVNQRCLQAPPTTLVSHEDCNDASRVGGWVNLCEPELRQCQYLANRYGSD
jgi:hypothetical protein